MSVAPQDLFSDEFAIVRREVALTIAEDLYLSEQAERRGVTRQDLMREALRAYFAAAEREEDTLGGVSTQRGGLYVHYIHSTWPTNESTQWIADEMAGPEEFESCRADLRMAMLADPVMKAAIRLRDAYKGPDCLDGEIGGVYDAVNEVGL